jgi:hypothetical protein
MGQSQVHMWQHACHGFGVVSLWVSKHHGGSLRPKGFDIGRSDNVM